MFDNGGISGLPPVCRLHSRVLELDPATGAVVWQYSTEKRLPSNSAIRHAFFSPFDGAAQRLPNGNTLLTDGDWGRAFEVTNGGTIVWELMKPDYKRSYRAYRTHVNWQLGAMAWYW